MDLRRTGAGRRAGLPERTDGSIRFPLAGALKLFSRFSSGCLMSNNAASGEFVQKVENVFLFFLASKFQAGPVIIDRADFIVDPTRRQTRCADIVLIEINSVAAALLGMNDPE